MPHELTPVEDCGAWWVKREDKACFIGKDRPSGAKVRQYMDMAAKHPPGTPMVVGCSAHSAQQIYVADAALRAGAPAHIFVPASKTSSASTQWCIYAGANVDFVRPGYPTVYRARAKAKAKELGGCIRWDVDLAVRDTMDQTENIPAGCQRVIVPTGSGLTAAGVLAGLANAGRVEVAVVAVAVSGLAAADKITETADRFSEYRLPSLKLERHRFGYDTGLPGSLPDGSMLDPYYAAKAMSYVEPGDLLWVSGRRPDDL